MSEDEATHPEMLSAVRTISLEDLCETCRVEAQWVGALVDHGAIDPAGGNPTAWTFAEVSVVRIARAKRLQADFTLNAAGIALATERLGYRPEVSLEDGLRRTWDAI